MKIELTEEQLNNLKTFLQRVDLKGAEVPAYISIANALTKEFKEIKETKETKEDKK